MLVVVMMGLESEGGYLFRYLTDITGERNEKMSRQELNLI